tara:strand:- start:51 stop:209 length:159 start_codon:yes stop_codon:yes gene_type:complete
MTIPKYKTYEEIPTSVESDILSVSGETNIKKVSLEDINGFIDLMEGQNKNDT